MERLEPLAPPPNWGADEVSNFLEVAQRNAFGSFVQLRAPFAKLIAIDACYRRLIENLNYTREWFAAFFVLRATPLKVISVSVRRRARARWRHVRRRCVWTRSLFSSPPFVCADNCETAAD